MKTDETWMCVGSQAGIPVREGRVVDIGGLELAVFNLGDRAAAVENRCPHRGGPLSDGIVAGNSVVCPLHSWKVCFATGNVLRPAEAACVSTYPTRVKDGYIYVALPSARPANQPPAFPPCPPQAIDAGMQVE